MTELGMATPSADPPNSPVNAAKPVRLLFFRKVCSTILTAMWPEIPTSDFADLITCKHVTNKESCSMDEEEPIYCICDSSTEICSPTFIECAAKTQCLRVQWYHAICLNLEDNFDDSEWFCSDDCTSRSPYCCGDSLSNSPWIGCESAALCQTGEWFHIGCVGLDTVPDNDWYCSKSCQEASKTHLTQIKAKTDHTREYACAVTWRGLYHMAMVDAERENDGPAMMVNWKINMVDFWNNGHYKYLILGHRLLSGINGCLAPRLQHDLVWNRTANLAGGPGHNLALDLINEFLNNDFKENLKHRRGQYTDSQVEICSRITGTVGKALEAIYSSQIIGKYIPKSKTTRAKYEGDVIEFVAKYGNLFDVIPGREMKTFPKFVNIFNLKRPTVLNTRLSRYCSDLQSEFDVVPDEDDD